MKLKKLFYFLTKDTTRYLYAFSLLLVVFRFNMITSLGEESYRPILYCTAIAGFFFLVFTIFYKKINKLFSFTAYILILNFTAIFQTYISNQLCGLEFYVFGSIPAIFIFTTDCKKPRLYYVILNVIFFAELIYLTYVKVTQPLEVLWLIKPGKYFVTSIYFCTMASCTILFFGCTTADIILRRMEKKEKFMKNAMDFGAKHDPLTGLMNRRRITIVFDECEKMKADTGNDYAIAMFDIDDFKKINDVHGHSAGDHVLKTYSKRVWDAFPDPVKIGRWGGEEFVIIFPYYNDEIIYLLEEIRAEVSSQPVIFEGVSIPVTATYGISSSKNHQTAMDVLKAADEYLYIGKQNGKNRLLVSTDF